MIPDRTIILLDLNFTLVANSEMKVRQSGTYADKILSELYRQWLVDLIRPYHVILCTVRHESYRDATLANIRTKTGWQPDEAFFNPTRGEFRGGIVKKPFLLSGIFPVHGLPSETPYLAIESATGTRAMYHALKITAVRQEDCQGGLPAALEGW